MSETTQKLIKDIDTLDRRTVTEARAKAPNGVLREDPLRRTPRKPCKDGTPDMPVPPQSAIGMVARLDARNSRNVSDFLPPLAQAYNLDGAARVRALTSPSGCVVYAEIVESSRSELLYDSALASATEGARFFPATSADTRGPIAAHGEFGVRFKLE